MTTCQVVVDKQIGSTFVPGGASNVMKELRHAHAPLLTFTKDMRSDTSCSTISWTIDNPNQVHSTSEEEDHADMEYQLQRKRM